LRLAWIVLEQRGFISEQSDDNFRSRAQCRSAHRSGWGSEDGGTRRCRGRGNRRRIRAPAGCYWVSPHDPLTGAGLATVLLAWPSRRRMCGAPWPRRQPDRFAPGM